MGETFGLTNNEMEELATIIRKIEYSETRLNLGKERENTKNTLLNYVLQYCIS